MNITVGHLKRHAPAQSGQGYEAAIIDVGQDLLLHHLAQTGVLDLVAFKGGTALRKVFAGASGRFSTDLDFSVASLHDAVGEVIELLTDAIRGTEVGDFRFEIATRRGRPEIVFHHPEVPAGQRALSSKLDVGPPPWLAPTQRGWVPVPIHSTYGVDLPEMAVVDMAEIVAEKVARLNRRTLARDAYDLVWISKTPGLPELDRPLVRRLSILKCWVDMHGVDSTEANWATVPQPVAFDRERWLTTRTGADFDDENIGLLTTPPPDLGDLGRELSDRYRWLVEDWTDLELQLAKCEAGDRGIVLEAIGSLPGGRLDARVW